MDEWSYNTNWLCVDERECVCVRGVVWDQVILFSLSVVYFFGINWLVIYHLVCMLIE